MLGLSIHTTEKSSNRYPVFVDRNCSTNQVPMSARIITLMHEALPIH